MITYEVGHFQIHWLPNGRRELLEQATKPAEYNLEMRMSSWWCPSVDCIFREISFEPIGRDHQLLG